MNAQLIYYYIIPFFTQTPEELIKLISPDVLVKASDYQIEKIVGYKWVLQKGGKVTTIPLVDGFRSLPGSRFRPISGLTK